LPALPGGHTGDVASDGPTVRETETDMYIGIGTLVLIIILVLLLT
jgi:hypothetical protein